MKKIVAFLCVVALLNTGCAAIFNGTKENLTIRSNQKGSSIYLNGNKVGTDSANVIIPKKDLKSAVIKVSKAGCQDATTAVPTTVDPATFLGILIDFGIISILVVDGLATGAITKASQEHIELSPVCGA